MTTKLVIFDIDGTLLTEKKVIPNSAKQAIQELQQKGINVMLATGRAPHFTAPIAKELNIRSYITNNGALINYNGDIIYERKLDKEVVRDIFGKCEKYGDRAILQLSDSFISPGPVEDKRLHGFFNHYAVHLPSNLSFDYLDEDGFQFYIHCPIEKEGLYGFENMNISLVRYNNNNLDIMTKGMNKSVGIKELLGKIGVSREEVVAFGDGLNDIEMLSYVGTGIALGNGEERLKSVADYVTKPVEEDGILYGLKKIGLL